MDFWSGALGFFLGLAANNISERWTLYRAHRDAKKLVGEWVAHNYQRDNPRSIDPQTMPGAGLTVISARSWWRTHSHILDVHAQDVNSGQVRNHHGWIAIDPARPQRATRTLFYEKSDEIEEQRILISDDGNTLHVSDESVGGGYSPKHALRRRMSPVGLIMNSMAPEPAGNGAPLKAKQEDAVPCARRRYALPFFVVSCVWLGVVTVLLLLNGLSAAHVSDSVLIAAIAAIPALFAISRFLVPGAPARPHFANFEFDPKERKYRILS